MIVGQKERDWRVFMKTLVSRLLLVLIVGFHLASTLTTRAYAQGVQSTPAGVSVNEPIAPKPSTASVTDSSPAGGLQSTTTPANQTVPDRIIYQFFFNHVVNLDNTAKKMEDDGKNADYLRDLDQKGAGLTEDEAAKVKQVAHDCIQLLNDQKAKIQATIDARRAQSSNPPKNLISRSEMAQNGAAKNATLDEHIAQLKDLLGEESFTRLDAYVKNLIHLKTVELPGMQPKPEVKEDTPQNTEGKGGTQ